MEKSITQQIKDAYPLPKFVAPYTGGLKASGRRFFIGRCPFHQDPNDPPTKLKFWVSEKYNICGCFNPRCPAYANKREDPGTRPLDVINFYALLNNVTLADAIRRLSSVLVK